jgi:hypothetical protein
MNKDNVHGIKKIPTYKTITNDLENSELNAEIPKRYISLLSIPLVLYQENL